MPLINDSLRQYPVVKPHAQPPVDPISTMCPAHSCLEKLYDAGPGKVRYVQTALLALVQPYRTLGLAAARAVVAACF